MCGITVFTGNIVLPNCKISASLFKYLYYYRQASSKKPHLPHYHHEQEAALRIPNETDYRRTGHSLTLLPKAPRRYAQVTRSPKIPVSSPFPCPRWVADTEQTENTAPSPVCTFLEDCSSLLTSAATVPGQLISLWVGRRT